MTIPTEPIGSIPRPPGLIDAVAKYGPDHEGVAPLYRRAIEDTVRELEATGSPVITDGEQRKYHNFWDYPVQGLINTAPDGFRIPFAAGHTRRMPRLVRGPFSYRRYADEFLAEALRHTRVPVKQAVISPSALSLMYPAEGIADYSREERARLGVHTCPGGDRDSTHSADVDYAELLPSLFQLNVRNFFVALAGEKDRARTLSMIRRHLKPGQRVFVGVVAPIEPRVESAAEVRDRVLQAADYIPVEQLGTTDDCGFSPFCDDTSTTREQAFAKIRARVEGTRLAGEALRGRTA